MSPIIFPLVHQHRREIYTNMCIRNKRREKERKNERFLFVVVDVCVYICVRYFTLNIISEAPPIFLISYMQITHIEYIIYTYIYLYTQAQRHISSLRVQPQHCWYRTMHELSRSTFAWILNSAERQQQQVFAPLLTGAVALLRHRAHRRDTQTGKLYTHTHIYRSQCGLTI